MKTINYTGNSKLISRIVHLLNRKAPLPLDGDGDAEWGTNGQVLTTDGQGNTSWTTPQGGGGDVTDVEVNGTSVVNAQGVAEVSVPTKTSDLTNDSGFITSADVPTKTSDLTNDSGFITSADVPTKTSDLTNDSGFITNLVNNLANYYTKSQTYTQAEVDALISGIVTLNILVVQTLPTQDISTTTIYLVPKQDTGTSDIYDEYLYINNAWELIGTTQIDLSNYVTTTDLSTALADYVTSVGLATILAGYAQLSDLPTVNDGTLTIQQNGTTLGTFTANQSGNTTVNLTGGGSTYTEGDGIDISNNEISVDTTFTEASTRANIASGDSFSTILGKIKKFFTDLKTVAFTGNSSDLNNDAGFITSSGSCASATTSSKSNWLNGTSDFGTMYASDDTHIMQLGYFTRSDGYNNSTILISSEFWGNLHGSADIINMNQDSNGSNTQDLWRVRISDKSNRTFYYKVANDRIYLYAYVTGGNSYGRWNITELQGSSNTAHWVSEFLYNQSSSGLTEIGFSGQVGYANSAGSATDSTKLPLAGGTLTGNLKVGNITIYSAGSNGGINSMLVGDNVTIGDCNVSGCFGMKSTVTNAGFRFYNNSGDSLGGLQSTNGTPQWIESNGTARNLIHSGNIDEQSVAIAVSAENADRAYMDSVGNVINTSYLRLSGGTMTGKLSLGGVSTSYGDSLEIRSTSSGTVWPLALKNVYNANETGFGAGIKLANGSESETGKWAGIRAEASSGYSNRTDLVLYASASERARISNDGIIMNGTKQVQFGDNTIFVAKDSSSWLNLRSGNGNVHRAPYHDFKNSANSAWVSISAGGFVTQSSKRYKENIEDMTEEEAKKILDVRTVSFDYKDGVRDEDRNKFGQHGVIAEEVNETIPEVVTYAHLVREDPESELVPDSVDYAKFVPYLIKMVQVQQKEIDELKAIVTANITETAEE